MAAIVQDVRRVVNDELNRRGLHIDKVYLIGSYAAGKQTGTSDIDILVELTERFKYPTWSELYRIHKALPKNVHVIVGRPRQGAPIKEIK